MAPLSTAGTPPLSSYISRTQSPPCPDLTPCLEHLQSTISLSPTSRSPPRILSYTFSYKPTKYRCLPLSRKSLQATVTSVTTVTLGREPHREGLFSVTIGVTVYGLPTKGPSQRKPVDMGSVTTVTLVTVNRRGSLKGYAALS